VAIFKRGEGKGHKDEDRREEGLAGVSLFIMHSRLLKIVLVSIPMLLSGFEVPEPNFLLDINGINVGAETDHICVLEEKLGEDIGGKPVCYGSLDESGRMEPPEDALFVQVVTGKARMATQTGVCCAVWVATSSAAMAAPLRSTFAAAVWATRKPVDTIDVAAKMPTPMRTFDAKRASFVYQRIIFHSRDCQPRVVRALKRRPAKKELNAHKPCSLDASRLRD
jgi:hypothetical protein